jgi:hypothetical protein
MNLFHILPVVLRNMDTFRSNIHGKYPRAGLTMFYSLSLSLPEHFGISAWYEMDFDTEHN